ncbi:hypothetical protein ACFQV2_33035 [Actinokineospora soli]|uniref:Uncharacterized protein n=1 Tax=Actinokineospora soli TaxID=1048753 RepID=A0ABW2TUX2_9PSEU
MAVVHGSRLFVFFQGNGGMVGVVSGERDGGWVDHGVIPRAVHWPPVPVVLGERLVLLVRDYLEPRWLGATDTEGGSDWVAQPTSLDDVGSTPAVVVRGHHATVVYRDLRGAVNAVELLAPNSWGARVADVESALHEVAAGAACDEDAVARYRDRFLVCEQVPSRVRVVAGGEHAGEDGLPVKPGSCQVVGDYLALAADDDGLVRFFDLRPIARGRRPCRCRRPSTRPGGPSRRGSRRSAPAPTAGTSSACTTGGGSRSSSRRARRCGRPSAGSRRCSARPSAGLPVSRCSRTRRARSTCCPRPAAGASSTTASTSRARRCTRRASTRRARSTAAASHHQTGKRPSRTGAEPEPGRTRRTRRAGNQRLAGWTRRTRLGRGDQPVTRSWRDDRRRSPVSSVTGRRGDG